MPVTKSLSNKTYDVLKYIALVVLPAVGALYFGLAAIWDLPKVNEVLGTIAVLDTVLGLLLKKINDNYMQSDERFDGSLVVSPDEVTAQVDVTPEVLAEQKEVVLQVDDHTDDPVELFTTAEPAPAKKAAPRKRAPRKKI